MWQSEWVWEDERVWQGEWAWQDEMPQDEWVGVIGTFSLVVTKQSSHLPFVPHEYPYLNQTVLHNTHNFSASLGHQHFVLKSQPQASIQLRNEMLQRGARLLLLLLFVVCCCCLLLLLGSFFCLFLFWNLLSLISE